VIRNSLLYVSSSVFSKAVPFLLLPLFTNFLSPAEFGLFSIYQVILAFAIAVFGMSLQTSVTVNYFKLEGAKFSKYIGNIFIILLFNIALFFILIAILSGVKDSLFSIEIKYLYLLIPMVLINTIIEIYTSLLRNEQKAVKFFFVEISNTLLRFLAITVLIVLFNWGWESFPLGSLIGMCSIAFYSFYSILKDYKIEFKFDKDNFFNILNLCIPLIPHTIGSMIIVMSDRLFIEKMVGMDAVGIYSVGFSFGMTLGLISDAFIKAWSPWFYNMMKKLDNKTKTKIVTFTYVYSFFIIISAFFVYIMASILIPLMTPVEYHGATIYAFWIALAYSIQGIYKIFFPYLVFFSKTKYLAISTGLAALISVSCNYFFINWFGAIGATYSAIIAYLVSCSCVVFVATRQIKLPWLFFKQ